ncbi:hypothetical protein ALAU109921_02865 [Alteromonas australica]
MGSRHFVPYISPRIIAPYWGGVCAMSNRKFSLQFRVLLMLLVILVTMVTLWNAYSWLHVGNLVWWKYFQVFTGPFVIYAFSVASITGNEPSWLSKNKESKV